MRTAVVGLVLVAFAGAVGAQPPAYRSDEGRYAAKFPGAPKVSEQTAKTALGDLKVTTATFANSDGGTFLVSFTDFPATATKPENHATLFAGVRDRIKGDGKLVGEEKVLAFGPDKLPGREFTVEKKNQKLKFRVVLRDSRLYQIAVIGAGDFATGKDATAFLDSFELTK